VPDGPALVVHHGTPAAAGFFSPELESAKALGLRLIAYDRPGYARSTPRESRDVAQAVGDVAAILDELGIERFATYGISGGGPHALACAALLPDRCAGAASVAGVGPADAPDLDFMAGMGDGNIEEFGAAREGREQLDEHLRDQAGAILGATPDELSEAIRPHLSDLDAEALSGEFAAFLLGIVRRGLAPGLTGWLDDDYAFLGPWGFDVGAIAVPTLVWQGRWDLMVPPAHGAWLLEHVAGAEGEVFPDEGHLTLTLRRLGEVQAWLKERL
jgi:pimeloyl-ACP methyl ester carboxylesterase